MTDPTIPTDRPDVPEITYAGDISSQMIEPEATPQTVLMADDFSEDEGFAESSNSSFVSTLASNIRRGIEENGRTYPAFGKNEYGLPVDEAELERNDFQHCKFTLILEGNLHLAPIGPEPKRILDLGTGTGIWAIDMADRYPTAEVIGLDIAPVQPTWVPPNCFFEVDDVESDWVQKPDSFDLIHAREFLLSIRDWDRLIHQSYEHIQPGGYLELSGTYPKPASDDNSIPEGCSYKEFTDIFFAVGEKIGASGEAPTTWKRRMEQAGFVDVVENVFKVPATPWPKDRRFKQIGAMEKANFDQGAEAILIRGMTHVLGRTKEEAQVLFANARNDTRNPKMHAYIYFYNVHGRKPT